MFRKFIYLISLFIFLLTFIPTFPAKAYSTGTWTQTNWAGGAGQTNWLDATKYSSAGGDGIKFNLTAGQISMDQAANVVIGQPDFISSSGNQGGSLTANTLNAPRGIYSNGTKLFVADYANNCVLIYNSIPTSNNASADVVIGQPNFISNTELPPAANTLASPIGVYSDGTKLFVSDEHNMRVLVYNTIPTSNNASADVVFGQADFVTNLPNRGGSTGTSGMSYPYGVSFDGARLYVTDELQNRVLIYSGTHTSALTSSAYDSGAPYTIWGPLTFTGVTSTTASISFETSIDGGTSWQSVLSYVGQKFGPSQALEYRAILTNTDNVSTPTLQDVTIQQNAYAPSVSADNAPSTPTNFHGSAIANGQAYLTWTASSGATKYYIYQLVGSNYEYLTQITNTHYMVSGLTNGTTYSFKVSALDSNSLESAATSAVSVAVTADSGADSYNPPSPTPIPSPTPSVSPTPTTSPQVSPTPTPSAQEGGQVSPSSTSPSLIISLQQQISALIAQLKVIIQ